MPRLQNKPTNSEPASQMAARFLLLRSAVELELRRKPNDKLAAACKDLTARAVSLALLAQALLSDALYRLLRDAVALTAAALSVRKAEHAKELLRLTPLLWSEGLTSPNREVRVHLLSLFTALAPEWAAPSSGLREEELDALAKGSEARNPNLLKPTQINTPRYTL